MLSKTYDTCQNEHVIKVYKLKLYSQNKAIIWIAPTNTKHQKKKKQNTSVCHTDHVLNK